MKTYEVKVIYDDKDKPPWVWVLCNKEPVLDMSVEEWNRKVSHDYRIKNRKHTLPKTPRKKGHTKG